MRIVRWAAAVVLTGSCAALAQVPPLPPGGSCVITVQDVTTVYFGPGTRSKQVKGGFQVAKGWSFDRIEITAKYLDKDNNYTGFNITQTLWPPPPVDNSYLITFLSMPQTTDKFHIHAKIRVFKYVPDPNNPMQPMKVEDAYAKFHGNPPIAHQLWP